MTAVRRIEMTGAEKREASVISRCTPTPRPYLLREVTT